MIMTLKIDTKERFTVIMPTDVHVSANMTPELNNLLLSYLQKDIPHIVFNMNEVATADIPFCEALASIQKQFYAKNCSFVICNLQPAVKKIFNEREMFQTMNVVPTESEAWDIVQMEEIERELLND